MAFLPFTRSRMAVTTWSLVELPRKNSTFSEHRKKQDEGGFGACRNAGEWHGATAFDRASSSLRARFPRPRSSCSVT
jgi:prenyltransferase beta subunit